jgi:hypothetical protein
LLNRARAEGRPFNELLQYYAMERFLYRLGHSVYQERFVLKGALMFMVWQSPIPRPTRDVDLLARMDNGVRAVTGAVRDICQVPVPNDGLRLDPGTVIGERVMEAADYPGVRARFVAFLGRARIPMQVDVGFGDPVIPVPSAIRWPTLLDFPAPELMGYSRESTVAEKLQIMVRLGAINSRMKDFFDVWLLAVRSDFEGEVLTRAIRATFRQRGTAVPVAPVAFSDAFARDRDKQLQWEAFLRRYRPRDEANVPTALHEVVRTLAAFLGPALKAVSDEIDFHKRWPAGGPWSRSS